MVDNLTSQFGASACLCGFGYGLVFVLWVLLPSFAPALRFGDALLYESADRNQIHGLPSVCNIRNIEIYIFTKCHFCHFTSEIDTNKVKNVTTVLITIRK